MRVIICAFLCFGNPADVPFKNPPVFSVHYVSWIETIASPFNYTGLGYSKLAYASKSDDSPGDRVSLGFNFPFLGVNYNSFYVDPNGALEFDTSYIPPCAGVFEYVSCNFNSSYYGTIAVFLADLFPGQSKESIIYMQSQKSAITITYYRVPYWNISGIYLTFSAMLEADGHIALSYYEITPPYSIPALPPDTDWLVGIRGSPRYKDLFSQTVTQHLDQKGWFTSYPGIYPQRDKVRSNSTFHACLVSDHWCLRPSSVTVGMTTATVHISTLSVSCLKLLDIFCVFRISTIEYLSSASFNSSINTFVCSVPSQATENPTTIPVTLRGYFKNVNVGKYAGGKSLQYVDLTLYPLNITVTTLSSPTLGCISTTFSSLCDNCAICNSNFSCLRHTFGTCHALYDMPSCNNTCLSSSVGPTSQVMAVAALDKHGKCCDITDIDCSGTCLGHKVAAYDGYGHSVCCAVSVDCNNVCGGKSVRDHCGVCGGMECVYSFRLLQL